MFDIVIDYPDSAPALQDLAVCLQHTSLAGHFAATFKAALQQRLLHAGAATADIITTYVSTIRAMQQVDKSGEGERGGARLCRVRGYGCVVRRRTPVLCEGVCMIALLAGAVSIV